MDKQILKQKLKEQAKQIGWRAITTVILTLTAVITVWAYAAFTEPLAGPNDSDQDFLQNILGANNNDNDFNSSNVVANLDGSIIERLEGIASSTCGNGLVESGEGCDDGSTSWTVGTCAGDCSRINYWSNPRIGIHLIGHDSYIMNSFCQIHNFNSYTTFSSTSSLTNQASTRTSWSSFDCATYLYSILNYSLKSDLSSFTSKSPYSTLLAVITTTGCNGYSDLKSSSYDVYTNQIWCVD
ncbi:MAG: hypothetical protein WC619_01590 [Patescibacteria group bacterium]